MCLTALLFFLINIDLYKEKNILGIEIFSSLAASKIKTVSGEKMQKQNYLLLFFYLLFLFCHN